MAWTNKPIWSEGLFVKPVHFQQQERYLEHEIRELMFAHVHYGWGFSHLELDQGMLSLGKVALVSAKGVMPDGTVFSLPETSPLPPPIDLDEGSIDKVVYLSLPIKSLNQEVSINGNEAGIFRYRQQQAQIQDVASEASQGESVSVAKLNFRLLLEDDKRSDYACMGVAHVLEKNKDQQVKLNARYVAPCLDINNCSSLRRYLDEIAGLLEHRAKSISTRISSSGTGGAAEVEDVMKLQVFNRNIPLFRHFTTTPNLHPEWLYRNMLQLVGELSTFSGDRIAPRLPDYQHFRLFEIYEEVSLRLKELLGREMDPRAINLPLKDPRFGIYRAVLQDSSLLDNCSFILAVKADAPSEQLRQALPGQTRVASIEVIRDLIRQQMPGIPLRALPVAPRQLPFHQGFIYFELDKQGENWNQLKNSSGFAVHISGNYSGVELEFWAIKSN